jgi:hypothetical protein
MRTLVFLGSFLFIAFAGQAQNSVYVPGYIKSDGTYVQGHYRQTSNNTNHDNWSTVRQYNPYTNTTGSRARDYSNEANNYGSGNTIYTGSRGGQYYYNSNGNKVYVPKRNGF